MTFLLELETVPGRQGRDAPVGSNGHGLLPPEVSTGTERSPVCMSSAHQPQTPSQCIVPRGGDHCDFCGTPPVFKLYRCFNFAPNGKPVFVSGVAVGSWATCRRCAELVDKSRWNDLTDRAVRKFLKRHRVTRAEVGAVREQLAEVSRLFASHVLPG